MHHSFDLNHAAKYGVEEAIMIHHFQHWITVNQKLKRNCHEDRTWTYQTIEELHAHFSYWTFKQVRRILTSLEDKNVLLSNNFNKTKYDRTKWYAFVNEGEFLEKLTICPNGQMALPNQANGTAEKGKPIPDDRTDDKTACLLSAGADVKKSLIEEAIEGLKLPSKITKQHPEGKSIEISLEQIFSESIRQRKNFSTKEIHESWKILCEYKGYVRDAFSFISGTIEKLRNRKRSNHLAKGQKPWNETQYAQAENQKSLEKCKETSSGKDIWEQPSVAVVWEQMEREMLLNGSTGKKVS